MWIGDDRPIGRPASEMFCFFFDCIKFNFPTTYPLRVIQQLCGPNFTQCWSPSPLSGPLWIFYLIPALCQVTKRQLSTDPQLFVHVVIEWPLISTCFIIQSRTFHLTTSFFQESNWKLYNQKIRFFYNWKNHFEIWSHCGANFWWIRECLAYKLSTIQ